jgi:hypothetical protein
MPACGPLWARLSRQHCKRKPYCLTIWHIIFYGIIFEFCI